MKRIKNNKKNKTIFLVALLVLVTIGYAYLSQLLTINGTAKVNNASWNVYFANVQVAQGSVETTGQGDQVPTINSQDPTSLSYAVTLNLPGDYYEFTVDAVNDGSIDAMIEAVTSKLNNEVIDNEHPLPTYLDYSITYSDGVAIAPNQLLAHNTRETYKIRIAYKTDISASDLPSTPQTLSFNFNASYIQADNNAEEVRPTLTSVYVVSDATMYIGQPIPAGVNIRNTSAEAMADWAAITGVTNDTRPFYLKHALDGSNNISESYVGFVVTPEMAANNPGMTAGTYALRGAGATHIGCSNPDEVCEEVWLADSPYYDANKAELLRAFGSANCTDQTSNFYCNVSGLVATADSYGRVQVIGGYAICYVSEDGSSICDFGDYCDEETGFGC